MNAIKYSSLPFFDNQQVIDMEAHVISQCKFLREVVF